MQRRARQKCSGVGPRRYPIAIGPQHHPQGASHGCINVDDVYKVALHANPPLSRTYSTRATNSPILVAFASAETPTRVSTIRNDTSRRLGGIRIAFDSCHVPRAAVPTLPFPPSSVS